MPKMFKKLIVKISEQTLAQKSNLKKGQNIPKTCKKVNPNNFFSLKELHKSSSPYKLTSNLFFYSTHQKGLNQENTFFQKNNINIRLPKYKTKFTKRNCEYFKIKREDKEWQDWLLVVKNFYLQKHIETMPLFIDKPQDNRPYINISIYGKTFLSLVDSGANSSVLGQNGLKIINTFKTKLHHLKNSYVTTADGTKQNIAGYSHIPISIDGSCKILKVLIVPALKHDIILGADFLKTFKISLDFGEGSWKINGGDIHISIIESPEYQPLETRSVKDFPPHQQKQIDNVMKSYNEVSGETRLGLTNKYVHKIEIEGEPFKTKQYPLSPYMMENLNKELDMMLELGIVRPCISPFSSPVFLVKKKSKDNEIKYRFLYDGRNLNKITKKDNYSLPNVDSILMSLKEAKYLSSLDLRSAFWQIPLDVKSQEYTAFSIPGRGQFCFQVLPFGLCNSAQSMQRFMDSIFGPEFQGRLFVYLDDVILFSTTFDDHILLLREVLDKLKEANLTINLEKCNFFRKSINYLGFVVSEFGLHTDPNKVSAMLNYPLPRTFTEIKRFVGMASYYRRFIPEFSKLIAPLNDLLKNKRKGQKVLMTQQAKNGFEKLKEALISAPILITPNFNEGFTIQTDASDVALSACLTQNVDGVDKVVCYASRSLSNRERRVFTVTEKELAAVLFAFDKFRGYIEACPHKIIVITDHRALLWLNSMKNPAGRLCRWSVKLRQHNFEVLHRAGKLHLLPDALSRVEPVKNANDDDLIPLDESILKINRAENDNRGSSLFSAAKSFTYKDQDVNNIFLFKELITVNEDEINLFTDDDLEKRFLKLTSSYKNNKIKYSDSYDELIQELITIEVPGKSNLYNRTDSTLIKKDNFENLKIPFSTTLDVNNTDLDNWYIDLRRKISENPSSYTDFKIGDNGLIYKFCPSKQIVNTNVSDWKILVPSAQRQKIIKNCHSVPTAGHFGFFKTFCRISEDYTWPKMRKQISKFVRSCEICQSQKSPNHAPFGNMGKQTKVQFPFECLHIDLTGPFPKSSSQNSYLLVITDYFSKYVIAKPLRSANSAGIVKFLEHEVILVYGACSTITSDNGTVFQSTLYKALLKKYNIFPFYLPRYFPEKNLVERSNRSIKTCIRSFITGKNHIHWDKEISQIIFAINNSMHETIHCTPAMLVFGRRIPPSGNFYKKLNLSRNFNASDDDLQKYLLELGKLNDLYKSVQEKLTKAYQRNCKTYNLRKREVRFSVGDKVWKRNRQLSDANKKFASKLSPKFVLCEITKKISNLVYELKDVNTGKLGNYHVRDIKAYYDKQDQFSDN